MARIIYGPIITDIKGSIGGMTFQKNGSGTIARLKPRKTKTNTQKQRDQQPRLKQVQAAWNLLTLVNKVLWNDFAAINKKIGLDGQEKKLTGYQWFLAINENRLLFNDTILSAPPIYEIINPLNYINFTFINDELRFDLDPSLLEVRHKVLAYCSFIKKSSSKFNFNDLRLIKIVDGGIGSSFSLNLSSPNDFWVQYFNSVFPPELGNKSFYLMGYLRFIGKNSGISSLAYTAIAKFVWDGAKYVIE